MIEELEKAIRESLTPDCIRAIERAIREQCKSTSPADSEARWFARGLRVCVLGQGERK